MESAHLKRWVGFLPRSLRIDRAGPRRAGKPRMSLVSTGVILERRVRWPRKGAATSILGPRKGSGLRLSNAAPWCHRPPTLHPAGGRLFPTLTGNSCRRKNGPESVRDDYLLHLPGAQTPSLHPATVISSLPGAQTPPLHPDRAAVSGSTDVWYIREAFGVRTCAFQMFRTPEPPVIYKTCRSGQQNINPIQRPLKSGFCSIFAA